MTIVATSKQVYNALAAADILAKEGIELEVIDPRTINPLDVNTIADSVRRTHRLAVVTEDCLTGSFASEVAARMGEIIFDSLEAPIMRVAAEDVPIPANIKLEAEAIPQVKDIIAVVHQMLGISTHA